MLHLKWKKVDQAEFLIRIGQCLDKGYNLENAIKMQTYEQTPKVKHRAARILRDLKSGLTVYDAFLNAGFPKVSCSFLFFSIQAGQLSNGFFEGGRYLKMKEMQKEKLNRLMRYPLFLSWIFAVMLYIVLKKLLPSFQQLYQAMSIDLPFIVKMLLAVPSHLGTLLVIPVVAIGMATLLIVMYFRKFSLQERLTHLAKTPFISAFLKMYLSYYFAFHLGSLLKVGLSVNHALQLIEDQSFQPFFKAEAEVMRKKLVNGMDLTDIIGERNYYTRDLPIVIRNGEAQSHLGNALRDYSQIILTRLEGKVTATLSMIQPLFFLLFGGLIVGLFLSILTPMFAILKGL